MALRKDQIASRLDSIRNLPTLPAVLDRLRQEINNPKSDAASMARIIEDDPAMMSRILKVVNSPLFAGAEPIRNLQLAVARMGISSVNNIALSTSVFAVFSETDQNIFNRKQFWRHTISTGILVNLLYEKCAAAMKRHYTKDTLHLVGLLHDMGKIIFEQHFHEEFLEALTSCREIRVPLFQIELDHIGTDHAQVGHWLGQKWRLGDDICEVIRWHHEPDNARPEVQDLTMLCHVANFICNKAGIGESGDAVAPAFFRSVWKRLGLDEKDVPELLQHLAEASKQSVLLQSLEHAEAA